MWDGWREGGKPERAELRNQIDVGSSVPPESPSMSGDGKALPLKVAESQNGKFLIC